MPGIEDILRMALAGGGGGGALPIDMPGMAGPPEMPPEALMMALGGAGGGGMVDPRMMGGPPMPMAPQMGPSQQQQQPQQPQQPPRNEWVKGLLSNFLYSLSQGLPVGAAHGPAAGFGAALGAPFRREQEERKMRLDEARAADEMASARQRGAYADRIYGEQDTRLRKMEADIAAQTGRTALAGAQAGQYEQETITLPDGTSFAVPKKDIAKVRAAMIGGETQRDVAKVRSEAAKSIADTRAESAMEQTKLRIASSEKIAMRRASGGGAGGGGGRGFFVTLKNNRGVVQGFFNAKTREFVDSPIEGARTTGLSDKEVLRRDSLAEMIVDLDSLEVLGKNNKDSIGLIAGNWAGLKRRTVGTSDEVNDMFRIADNVADVLLRARSGAAITEKEYVRLRKLTPDPRGPEGKFFSDLRGFRSEISAYLERGLGGAEPGARGAGGVMDAIRGGGKKAAPAGGGGIEIVRDANGRIVGVK